MPRLVACLFLLSWLFLTLNSAQAQPERLELGKRLRRFELAWESAPESNRLASARPMQLAVSRFFALQFNEAMERLDEAWRCVDEQPLTDPLKAAIRFQIDQDRRVAEPSQDTKSIQVIVKLIPTYGGPLSSSAAPTKIRWEIRSPSGETVAQHEVDWDNANAESQLVFPWSTDGDYRIECTMVDGAVQFPLLANRLCVISDLESRLAAAEHFYQATKDDEALPKTARATLGDSLGWLRALKKKIPLEIEYPGTQLLQFCEGLIANKQDFSNWIAKTAQQQDCWLTLVQEKRRVAVRLRAPANISEPLPVLFLFHGAGGSENMFFETYGAGRAVHEGIQRGWLVVAPRLGFAGPGLECGAILDELSKCFPIDRKRVMMIGHSMGAGQVVRQATLDPTLPAALAALGGGARPGKLPEVAKLPWFIGAGELDFGKRSAATLRDALAQNQADQMEFREYSGVEHMVIVQAALSDVFAYFDKQLLSKP